MERLLLKSSDHLIPILIHMFYQSSYHTLDENHMISPNKLGNKRNGFHQLCLTLNKPLFQFDENLDTLEQLLLFLISVQLIKGPTID